MNDLDEELGYDADHDDPRQYCEHGTFIGSWWGPDYLCGWCEMGVSVDEMRALHRAQAQREAEAVAAGWQRLLDNVNGYGRDHRERAYIMCKVVAYILNDPSVDRYHRRLEEEPCAA